MVPGGVWGEELVVLIGGETSDSLSARRHPAAVQLYRCTSRTSSLGQKETPKDAIGNPWGCFLASSPGLTTQTPQEPIPRKPGMSSGPCGRFGRNSRMGCPPPFASAGTYYYTARSSREQSAPAALSHWRKQLKRPGPHGTRRGNLGVPERHLGVFSGPSVACHGRVVRQISPTLQFLVVFLR